MVKRIAVVGPNKGDADLQAVCDLHQEMFLFEPMPDAAEWLVRNNADSAIHVIQAACGVSAGHSKMNVYNNGLSTSFGVCTVQAAECYSGHDLTLQGVIDVNVVNLYEYFTQRGIDGLETLLTDAQGMDLTILKTVTPWLQQGKLRTIICEADQEGFSHYDGLPPNNTSDFHAFMSQFPKYVFQGYTAAKFNPDMTWVLS
jgi:FkbM family methyltransferase